jgi:thiamine pyrophosphate-dependent acetolactate synthase large subunit-like protein
LIADAYGIPWSRPETAADLETELTAALSRDSPTLIIAPIPAWV